MASLNETFTGSAAELSTHTSDSGHTWTNYGSRNIVLNGSGVATADGSQAAPGGGYYVSSCTEATADYDVDSVFIWAPGDTAYWGLMSRTITTGEGYYVRWAPSGTWELRRLVDDFLLGTLADSWGGSTRTVKLRCQGSSISAVIASVGTIGPVTDTNTSAANHPGLFISAGSSLVGHGFDYVTTTNLGTGGGATTEVWGSTPASTVCKVASTNFNVSLDGTPGSTITVTPADSISGTTFSPSSLSFTVAGAGANQTFTATATRSGSHSISLTNSGSLTNPTAKAWTVTPIIEYTLKDPSGNPVAGLSGLHWNSRDISDINSAAAPTDHGSAATTDGAGSGSVSIPNSTKTYGQNVMFELENTAATSGTAPTLIAVT
jgi:hypothetical protein